MMETRMTVRTQQRPTTRTLVKWAWIKKIETGTTNKN